MVMAALQNSNVLPLHKKRGAVCVPFFRGGLFIDAIISYPSERDVFGNTCFEPYNGFNLLPVNLSRQVLFFDQGSRF